MADIKRTTKNTDSDEILKKFLNEHDWADNEVQKTWFGMKELMSETWEHAAYTTDLPELMQKDSHYVFVYGTLKKGFRNHRMIQDEEFVGPASTLNNYSMVVTKNTAAPFPIVFPDGREGKKGAIYGEVYKVKPKVIRNLDYLESNGTMYKRSITPVYIAFKDGSTKKIYAFMYKGKKDYWSSREKSLKLVKPFVSHKMFDKDANGRYFYFTKALEAGIENKS